MATKRKAAPFVKIAAGAVPAPFDLEARMSASMSFLAKMEAGIDKEKLENERQEWALDNPFVYGLVTRCVKEALDTPSKGVHDSARKVAAHVAAESYLGHYIHHKACFGGIVRDVRFRRDQSFDVMEVDVGPAPERIGGGIVIVKVTFSRV